jgi:hypothetical protein
MTRVIVGSALAVVALSLSAPVLSQGDEFSRGRPSTRAQGSEAVQPSQDLSGSGDARRGRSGSVPDAAVTGKPEARFSTRSTESDRLIDNPEKRNSSPAERALSGNARAEPGVPERDATPGPSIQDRSGEVR